MSRSSPHPRQAASLALYLTGAEVQKRRALRRGYMPTRPDLYDDPALVEALPSALVLGNAKPQSWVSRPSTVARDKYADVSRAYYQTVHRVLARKVEVAPALSGLEQELLRLTGRDGSRPD